MPISPTSDRSTQATRHNRQQANILDDYALQRVDYHVNRLGRSLRLTEDQRDDLRQDLLLDLCKAARRYDERRASPRTFVSRVLTWAAANHARCIRNERRCPARSPIHLSQLQRAGRSFAPLAPRSCEPAALDLALDMRRGLAGLGRRQQQLAESLKTHVAREIAAEHRLHPSTIYRDICAIRIQLQRMGISPAA